jgi:hypothetical protein
MRASAASALLFFVDRIFFHTWRHFLRYVSARFAVAFGAALALNPRKVAIIPGRMRLFDKNTFFFAVLVSVRRGGDRFGQVPAKMRS